MIVHLDEPGDEAPMTVEDLSRILAGDLAGWEELVPPFTIRAGEQLYIVCKTVASGTPVVVSNESDGMTVTEAVLPTTGEQGRIFRRCRP